MRRYVDFRSFVCTFIAMFFALSTATAQSNDIEITKQDSIVRSSSMYFKFDVSSKIDSLNYLEMGNLIFWVKRNKDAKINICGWTDPAGASEYNKLLSESRAKRAKKYLVEKGVDADRIAYIGMGIDYESPSDIIARRSTIMAVLDMEITEKPKKTPVATENKEQARPRREYKPTPTQTSTEPVVEQENERCGSFSLRTNLLYLAATSFNLGAEWNPCNTQIGIILNGGYAPFGGDGQNRNLGAAFISPEIRYYFGEDKHWFAGVEFLAGAYNYKLRYTGYQGLVYAGGFTGGYRIELSNTFDMDFSLGLGYGKLEYDTYYNNGEGNVLIESDIKKNTVMPIQAGVSLIWKIF